MSKSAREKTNDEEHRRAAMVNAGTHYAHWHFNEQGESWCEIREFSLAVAQEYMDQNFHSKNVRTLDNLLRAALIRAQKLEREQGE